MYFTFWMIGLIYSSINKPVILEELKTSNSRSFESNLRIGEKVRNMEWGIPTQKLQEIEVVADLPRKTIATPKTKKKFVKEATELNSEQSDEVDLEHLIKLIEEIRDNHPNLQTIAKRLPIVEVDSRAIKRTIQFKV